ncbi:MAG: type II toxin-antitoxin system VapC family toxin [Myxococcales bacterium]|nr:type II toxin-antitoxin system VapC family toxin [Myxococcales bacterium]MCB9522866.1 type II toxin-antitoxin system VapC family toxin [Myxococcales bacterium]
MIGLDTNVLVRLVVQDDPEQTLAAKQLIERAERRGEALYVSLIVMCEFSWVLKRAYGLSRDALCFVIQQLLATDSVFEDRDLLKRALARFAHGRADLADYLIQGSAASAGARTVATFDRRAASEPGFQPVLTALVD